MLGSVDNLSMISLHDFSYPEETKAVIPLDCWQDICLSKIWIPNHLLTNRRKPSNTWETRGIFHTLEKRGHAKQIESFSVYSDSDNESETDVFLSDSDDGLNLDIVRSDKRKAKENSLEFIVENDRFRKLKSFPSCNEDKIVKSNISLNEILNPIAEVDISNFEFKKDHKYRSKQEETLQSNKKNKNDKKKNKVIKSVTLDTFLGDYTEENRQEDYANDYLQKLFMSQNQGGKVQLKNNSEFPDLVSKEIPFRKEVNRYEKPVEEKSEISIKTLAEILTKSDKNENDKITTSHIETVTSEPEIVVGKIVIENIPSEVSHEDISALLCGFSVKDFTLKPDGDFLKAFVEINLDCDIDWITECLDGTEPFGVSSSRVLKCYKQ